MRYQYRSPVSKNFQCAIVAFACESIITITCGVVSLGSAVDHDPVSVGLRWVVALLIASALALSMAEIALKLYRRITFPALLALIILASAAVIFDASFFNARYMVHLQETTSALHDQEYRQREYDRLVQQTLSTVAKVRNHIDSSILVATQDAQKAHQAADYEKNERVPVKMRGCGPICEQHLRNAEGYRTAREHAESLREFIKKIPLTPASTEWHDLTQFHTNIIGLLGQIPLNGIELKSPAAPTKPSGLTQGGNAEGVGGLGFVIELLSSRDFKNPKIALPLVLGAICEYIVLVLIFGLRPWQPARVWFLEKLEKVEQTIDLMPALCPLLGSIFTRALLRDDDELRQKRHDRIRQRHEQEEELRTLKELQELELELSS